MDDIKPREFKAFERGPNRWRDPRSGGALELEAVTVATMGDEQVKFGAGVGRPEVTLSRSCAELVDHRFLNDDVPFLQGMITTAENIATCIWDRIAPRIEDNRECRLHRITLYESRNNYVVVRGPRV